MLDHGMILYSFHSPFLPLSLYFCLSSFKLSSLSSLTSSSVLSKVELSKRALASISPPRLFHVCLASLVPALSLLGLQVVNTPTGLRGNKPMQYIYHPVPLDCLAGRRDQRREEKLRLPCCTCPRADGMFTRGVSVVIRRHVSVGE